MKVLLVTQYFWPETFRINDLARGLVENGHEVTVLTGIPNYPKGNYFRGYGVWKNRFQNHDGILIHRIPLVSRGKGGGIRLILNYFSFAFLATLMSPFVCRDKYDVILVYMPSPITVGLPALLLKKLKRAPILFWVQDIWPESLSATGAVKSPTLLKWVGQLTKFIYKSVDRILVQSRAFIPYIERFGVSNSKIHYFPNSAEKYTSSDEREPEKNSLAHLPKGFKVIYTGNIGVAQSFETILQAAIILKEHKDIHWIIIGDGRQKEWLSEQLAAAKLDTVYLLGHKPAEEMPQYFNIADALLVTLKGDEIFALTIPSKLQSYLACGKPIIASLNGEPARIIEESGAGLVGRAEDAKLLAENVLKLYNADEQKRLDMGKCGYDYFMAHFERAKLLKQLEAWMTEVTGEKKCGY